MNFVLSHSRAPALPSASSSPAPRRLSSLVTATLLLLAPLLGSGQQASAAEFTLTDGWALQSSSNVTQGGAALSAPGFQPNGWYPITMPATIIAGLLQNNVFPDPFYAKNLSTIDPAQFTPTWWYRKEFTLPASENGKRVWLKFEGLNYRAAIWFNGTQLSNTTQTVGPFRAFEYDVTSLVNYTGGNAIAVQITGPTNFQSDLTIFFIDWNPSPPDKNMGIVNDVVVRTSGAAKIRNPLVSTKLDLPSLSVAHLTVVAEVTNGSNAAVSGTVDGNIGTVTFSQPVTLAARETKRVTFTPTAFPQLNFNNPTLWWPWEYGTPALHTLNLSVTLGGQVSDSLSTEFGIRQVTSALNSSGHRIFSINGKRILIRGAAWAPDMFQRRSPERQEAEVRYIRDLNLNLVRFEGKFEDENMFRLMDRYGLLVMVGWNCCDSFQRSGSWTAEQKAIAYDSLRNQMYRLRIHPSMMVWVNGSDEVSAPEVEQQYVNIEADLQWPAPTIAAAAARSTPQEGATGVKMNGPYEYEPPSYWESDPTRGGGAWGFSTEISPGADVPVIESLRKFIPEANLWPINTFWTYHCNTGAFTNLNVFTNAMNQRYGAANSAAEYAAKAQLSTYESHRAMFEAYGRKKYTATGVIQWMLNNAWPGMFWHVYDYYLQPGGTYFGVKNALEPLHVQYSYTARTVTVVNSTLQSFGNLTARAQVFNLDGSLKHNQSATLSAGPDSTMDAFTLPAISGLSPTYFLRLTLTNSSGVLVSQNTYWLSTKADVVDWASYGDPWYYTRQSAYADFKAIPTMPASTVAYNHTTATVGDDREHTVTLTNTGSTLAFFLRLKINRMSDGEEILPVIWQDNYVTLVPGESRTLKARYASVDLDGSSPALQIVPYLPNVTLTPATGPLPVAAPVFTPAPGTYASTQSVTIASSTSGASIRYTTDGSTPSSTAGTLYSGPVSIASTTTLRAIAYKAGLSDSSVTSGAYTIEAGTTDVKFSIPASAVTASANDGNLPANVVDGNLSTRWSASGDPQWIQFNLGGAKRVAFVKIAFYNGAARSSRFDVQTSTDGVTWANARTGVSSNGTSAALETFDFPDIDPANFVRIVGHGNTVNAWNSYAEVEIWGGPASGGGGQVASPTFSPAGGTFTTPQSVSLSSATAGSSIRYTTDGSTPNATTGTVYTGPIAVSATTTLRAIAYSAGMTDSAVTSATYTINSGSTPAKLPVAPPVTASSNDGNVPGNTIDGNLATRWSASGDGQWIQYNLGTLRTVSYLKIAFYSGNIRTTTFDVQVSGNGADWTTVLTRRVSSGTSTGLETFDFPDAFGQHVRIVGHGNSVNLWNSLTEVEIWGF